MIVFKGIACALAACFIWGLIFIIPQYMEGFSPIEVALGRYFFYGVISAVIFIKAMFSDSFRYPLQIWIKASTLALVSSMGYYTCIVLALRFCTPAICALILGISPITIAFYGNWKQKECSYKSLILPSVLICIGLLVINAPHILSHDSPTTFVQGLIFAFLALLGWTWFAVVNSQFLKQHSDISPTQWSTIIGVATLFWVLLFAGILIGFFGEELGIQKYQISDPELIQFLIGSSILGLLCSWVGASLWNKACVYLPISLAGQLMVFETIFGLLFFYALEQQLPPLLEALGIVFFLVAIIYGIRVSSRQPVARRL